MRSQGCTGGRSARARVSQLARAVCREGMKSTSHMGGTVFTKVKASNETTRVERLTGKLQVTNITYFPFLLCLQVPVPYTSILSKFTLRSLGRIRFKIIWKGGTGPTPPLPRENHPLPCMRMCAQYRPGFCIESWREDN